eukprot:GHVU01225778.1.p2 GENE.GHVU01225778.1~~GHVU01225778.1.p2  ORF type:complete len:157 (-),score=17.63 GHVU01225778.1:70-540(-)
MPAATDCLHFQNYFRRSRASCRGCCRLRADSAAEEQPPQEASCSSAADSARGRQQPRPLPGLRPPAPPPASPHLRHTGEGRQGGQTGPPAPSWSRSSSLTSLPMREAEAAEPFPGGRGTRRREAPAVASSSSSTLKSSSMQKTFVAGMVATADHAS